MANRGWKYDVFISFRGEDTRYNFTDHLYHALRQVGINAFRDNEELKKGEEIDPSLFQAIEESRASIVVFSKNYASSTWCLDELVKILECKTEKQLMVLPIFYEVDPSDVRHQRGSFGNAMEAHEERFKNNIEKVHKWRSALWRITNISGESYRIGSEHDFIQMIVANVSRHLNCMPLHVTEKPVGLESRTFKVVSLLGNGSDDERDVRMIGIYGIGGIGKTTIAKAVYNKIANQFEGTCFVADVRKNSTEKGLVHIQETILADILGKQDIKLSNTHRGVQIIKERLRSKKILLILDDVNDLQQLHLLVGEIGWFGSGSRVIITTKDKHLLQRHCGERTYRVKEFDDKEALELFCWHAFAKCAPANGYAKISADLIHYAHGNPLALAIIGSALFGRAIDEWECTLDKYKKTMHNDIFSILQNSYEDMEYNEKAIFLDIACFFQGKECDYIEKILEVSGFNAKSGLRVLKDRCLIKEQGCCVWMHDLMQTFGREVVQRESQTEPGRRSRIWFHKDALQVLTRDTGTSKIQGLMLEMPEKKKVTWSSNSFKKMINLRILIIRNAIFLKAPKHLPNSLKVLEWEEYPSPSLPPNFDGDELLDLRMSQSTRAIYLKELFMKFQNVTFMEFEECSWLVEVPNLSALPNLKKLNLSFCENLVKIDDSIRSLLKLEILSLNYCCKLRTFPTGDGWRALSGLFLCGCCFIVTLPIFSQFKSLTAVDFLDTGLKMECDIGKRVMQELLDAKCYAFIFDGFRIPRYFNHRSNGSSISFWICKELPTAAALSFAFRSRFVDGPCALNVCMSIGPIEYRFKKVLFVQQQVVTFNLSRYLLPMDYEVKQVLGGNYWVPVEIYVARSDDKSEKTLEEQHSVLPIETGIYIYNHGCDTNISFNHPYSHYRIRNTMLTVDNYNGVFSLDPLCKKVRSLNIPPQVERFAMTAIYVDLPSKRNLTRQGYRLEGVKCGQCKFAEETSIHVLKECKWARAVWLLSPLCLRVVDRMSAWNFRHWMSQLIWILDTQSLELFLTLAWCLWTERNKMHSGREEDVMCLIHRMNVLLEEHRRTHKRIRQDTDSDKCFTSKKKKKTQ